MEKYIIQEKTGDFWFDLYTNDLCILKKMIIVLKKKNPETKYRIVNVYV